jgi:hypothetical protein
MPKVISVPEGLYFVGTEEQRPIAQTNAGRYIEAFTKSREKAFNLALEQAMLDVENEKLRYETEASFIADRQKALQKRIGDIEKSLADIEQGRVDATNEMRKYGLGLGVDIAKKNADLEANRKKAEAEKAFPSVGSSWSVQTGDGSTFGTAERKGANLSEAEQRELAESSAAGGGNPITAAKNYGRKLQAAEGAENPTVLKTKQAALVENEKKQRAMRLGISVEEAEIQVLGELDADGTLDSFVDAYLDSKPPPPVSGDGAVSLRSGSERGYATENKYGKIDETTVGAPTAQQYDVEKFDPKQLEAMKAGLEQQLLSLDLPLPPEQDLITAARRLYRDRFGPTTGGRAGFEERLRSAALVNQPDRGAGTIENFRRLNVPEASEETKRSLMDQPTGMLASTRKPILDLSQFDASALEASRMASETPAVTAPMEPKLRPQDVFLASNQAKEKASKPSANRYLLSRYLEGKKLAEQGSRLDRLINSGPGKVASQVYSGNISKNLPLSKTLEEITFTYADDPEARDRAIDIAMALDLKSENSKKMPTA